MRKVKEHMDKVFTPIDQRFLFSNFLLNKIKDIKIQKVKLREVTVGLRYTVSKLHYDYNCIGLT